MKYHVFASRRGDGKSGLGIEIGTGSNLDEADAHCRSWSSDPNDYVVLQTVPTKREILESQISDRRGIITDNHRKYVCVKFRSASTAFDIESKYFLEWLKDNHYPYTYDEKLRETTVYEPSR